MDFATAGNNLIEALSRALYEDAQIVMRESLVECPISTEDTYIPQIRTIGSGPARKLIYLGDDPSMVGDNGTLRRSARVFPPERTADRVTVEMGYGFGAEINPAGRVAAEYAVPVHERHELKHTPPTKSGYLADPVLAYSSHMAESLAEKVDEQQVGAFVVVEGEALMESG